MNENEEIEIDLFRIWEIVCVHWKSPGRLDWGWTDYCGIDHNIFDSEKVYSGSEVDYCAEFEH